MKTRIFLNLAVKDLEKSMQFYTSMGAINNPTFSDSSAKCMVFSDEISVMIMTHEKFATFSSKTLADTKKNIAGLFALSVESIEKMHQVADKVLSVGGVEPTPLKDYGFMQVRTVEDSDGHTWEIFYLDTSKFTT